MNILNEKNLKEETKLKIGWYRNEFNLSMYESKKFVVKILP